VPEVDVCLLDKLSVWKRATMVTMFVGRIQKEKTDPEPISSSPRMLSYYMANGSLPYIKLGPRMTQVLIAGGSVSQRKTETKFFRKSRFASL
jgi:hypothetical protein